MLRRVLNLARSRYGWSFLAEELQVNRRVVNEEETVILSAVVANNGLKLGTAYVRFLVADSYKLDDPCFDSNRDFSPNERHAMRLLDIKVGEIRRAACRWSVPSGSSFKHFDIRLQIWNPHLLFGGPRPYLFYDAGWIGGLEVVSHPGTAVVPKAFISYSWDSEEHKAWVRQLVEELRKHNIDAVLDQKDLFPGDEATRFMEHGITDTPVTVLICSETYTRKADAREPGGAGFETIISSHEYLVRSPEERARFIPVVRGNSLPKGRKLPKYLGSAIYVDMSDDNWRAEPMLDLVAAIRRHC